jgi:hypothetical protein
LALAALDWNTAHIFAVQFDQLNVQNTAARLCRKEAEQVNAEQRQPGNGSQ